VQQKQTAINLPWCSVSRPKHPVLALAGIKHVL